MKRLHVTPSMVVALAALIVGVSGVAYASGTTGGGSITVCVSHKGGGLYQAGKCAKHDRKLTWNARGPVGPQGQPGQPGQPGQQGPAGVVGTIGPDQVAPVLTARIRLQAGQFNVPSSTETTVTFDKIVEDTGNMANLTTHPTTLVAPRDGVYLITGELRWFDATSSADSQRMGGIIAIERADGGLVDSPQSTFAFPGNVQFLIQPLSVVQRLQAGQQIALHAYQTTGTNQKLDDTDEGAFLQLTYLGR